MGLKPLDLIRQLRKGAQPAPGYLLLGAEPFYRNRCRKALREAVLDEDPAPDSVIEIDLRHRPLADLIDEARALSLFAQERLVIARNADHSVPRAGTNAAKEAQGLIRDYFADPSPGTVVVFEATKHDSRNRDEKAKLERVAKFYEPVPTRIELEPLKRAECLHVTTHLAKQFELEVPQQVLAQMVDMLGADAFRIENELQKLALYAGPERSVTAADAALLVPESREASVFEFSMALADRDRMRALRTIETMSQGGMYWPMQLNLIAILFRQALAAKELGAGDARTIASKLRSFGLSVWPARAQQIEGIVARFGKDELRAALIAVYEAYKAMRGARTDDRVAVEMLVMKLTS